MCMAWYKYDKANQMSMNVYSIFVSVLSHFEVRHMWRHKFEYSVSSRANALWMTVSTPSQAILWHCPCSAIHERVQDLLRVVNCKHAKAILYLMHCMSKTECTCMHCMSKTIVCLYTSKTSVCMHCMFKPSLELTRPSNRGLAHHAGASRAKSKISDSIECQSNRKIGYKSLPNERYIGIGVQTGNLLSFSEWQRALQTSVNTG